MRRTISSAVGALALAGCAASAPTPEPGSPAHIRQQSVDSWAEQGREQLQPARHVDAVYYNVQGRLLSVHAYCHLMAAEYGRRLDLASRR